MTAPPAGALEACPFCGAPGELLGSDVMWPLVIATCSGDCELMPSTHPASEADAIAAWNRRTHGTALLAALRLREWRSEEHTSELQSLMRISYALFCFKKKLNNT